MREKKHSISATEKVVLCRGFLCQLSEVIWLLSGIRNQVAETMKAVYIKGLLLH